jgi:nitrate/nitrite-specific signal transduction histidine kinase
MKNKLERFFLSSYTINQKLAVAFQLMSILPFLVCVYLVSNYILPKFGLKIDVIVTVLISMLVSIVGLLVIKEIFDRLTSMSKEAKMIAAGDINKKLTTAYGDEVDDLGEVLNKLTQRIRGNMEELKTYSERTHEINIEIQKRVVILSNVMQISSLIARGGKYVDILRMAVEKSRLLASSETAFLLFKEENKDFFCMKIVDGAKADYLMSVTVLAKEDIYSKVFNLNKLLILDKQNLLSENLTVAFLEKFQLKNCLALPIFLRGSVKAVLGIGNAREGFLYSKEDIELMNIFSKQIAIAMENNFLNYRIEKLEIKDILTGLYNQAFIMGRLQEEIQRAIIYQRPCSFIIFDIDNFKIYHDKFGLINTEAAIN